MRRRFAFADARLLTAPLLAAFLLCGCQGLRQRVTDTLEHKDAPDDPDAYKASAARVLQPKALKHAAPYGSDPIVVDEVVPEDEAKVDDKVQFPQSRAVDYPKVDIGAYPTTFVKGMLDPDTVVPNVSFAFDENTIQEVIPFFAEYLGFGYQIDPAVKGTVTLTLPECDMTAREIWGILEHILWLCGAYASNNTGFIHVVPFDRMPEERRLLAKHEPLANVEVAFVPIYHVASADIIKNLQPFMTKGASVTDLTAQNTLLFVEAPANMPKLRELIARLDDPGEARWPHACIQCHDVDADELLGELEELLPILGYPISNNGPSGGKVKLTAIPRLSTIVVSAALPDVLKEVTTWIRTLDVGDSAAKEDIFFYEVQHSTAEKLNEMLAVFFNADSKTSTTTSKTKSTSAKTTATTGSKTTTAETTKKPTSTSSRRKKADGELTDSIFDTPVVVYVDQDLNRLTLQTTRRAFSLIKAMLERHDIAPRQALVEAKIVEVSLSKSTQFGVSWAIRHSKLQAAGSGSSSTVWSSDADGWDGDGVTSLYPANAGSFSQGAGGVALGYLRGDGMAFVSAVAGADNTRVLAAPQVRASNGQEAEISIGREIAIKTTEYSSDYKSDYQYQPTGKKLVVTPHITAGNDVQLEILQEVSDVLESGSEDNPDLSKKTLSTTLVIPDGGTVIMGGLIDTSVTDGHTGVPLLKDVPLFGRLFRTNQYANQRSELLVLITVNVLDASTDSTPLLRRYQKALKAIEEQLD